MNNKDKATLEWCCGVERCPMPRHEKDFKLTEAHVLAVRHLLNDAIAGLQQDLARTYEMRGFVRAPNRDYWFTDMLHTRLTEKKTELAFVELMLFITKERVEVRRAQVDK